MKVEVVRSTRRKRQASLARRAGGWLVRLPAGLSQAVEAEVTERLLARAQRPLNDQVLAARAAWLQGRFLPELQQPYRIVYGRAGVRRWGVTRMAAHSIEINPVLVEFPRFVEDYVIMHELCHLLVARHDAAFHALLARYPRAERAYGYLLAKAED